MSVSWESSASGANNDYTNEGKDVELSSIKDIRRWRAKREKAEKVISAFKTEADAAAKAAKEKQNDMALSMSGNDKNDSLLGTVIVEAAFGAYEALKVLEKLKSGEISPKELMEKALKREKKKPDIVKVVRRTFGDIPRTDPDWKNIRIMLLNDNPRLTEKELNETKICTSSQFFRCGCS